MLPGSASQQRAAYKFNFLTHLKVSELRQQAQADGEPRKLARGSQQLPADEHERRQLPRVRRQGGELLGHAQPLLLLVRRQLQAPQP